MFVDASVEMKRVRLVNRPPKRHPWIAASGLCLPPREAVGGVAVTAGSIAVHTPGPTDDCARWPAITSLSVQFQFCRGSSPRCDTKRGNYRRVLLGVSRTVSYCHLITGSGQLILPDANSQLVRAGICEFVIKLFIGKLGKVFSN